jgi:tetratricopeptide (TPR) repeat protein
MQKGIRMRVVAGLAIGIAFSFQVAWAQKTGGPPANPGGPIGGTHLPPSTNGQITGPSSPSLNGALYLSGNVMLDDGTPPPDPVTIERVCGGAPRAQAYTDQKGRFSFQIGQTSTVMQDASEDGSNLPSANPAAASMGTGVGPPQQQQQPAGSNMQLANCDLRAVLAGFRSDLVSLGGRRLLDDPNVGTIVLHRVAGVEGAAVSMTSLAAPKDARRAYQRALQLLRKNKASEAAKELRKAVEIYPNYAAAWYELGRIQLDNQETAQARASFTAAIAADAKYVNPYLQLVEMEAQARNWAELAQNTSKLLKLDAQDYPMAYFYNAIANLNLGRLDEAEKSARAGEKLDVQHQYPRLQKVLATILAKEKDYEGAMAEIRTYLLLAPDAEDAPRMRKQLAELERLSGANDQAKAAQK